MISNRKYLWAAAIALLLLFVGPSAFAQDTLRKANFPEEETDTIIGGSSDIQFSQHLPLSGNRTLNRITGRQTYDEFYSHLFCEFEYLVGADLARGVNFAYLWKRWGVYGSLLGDYYTAYGSLGAVIRPYTRRVPIDWQFYGGLAGSGYGLGYEFGTRIAANACVNGGSWGWWSGSVGMMQIGGISYTTIGISLAIIGCTGLIIL